MDEATDPVTYACRSTHILVSGRLAQLVRAAGLQPAGRGFESLSAHKFRLREPLGGQPAA